MTKSLIIAILSIFMITKNAYCTMRSISYEEAWEEGKFKSQSLQNVATLYHIYKTSLNEEQKHNLVASKTLSFLKTLDLSYQNIDDEFIRRLCNNRSFARIINLNLTGNSKITDQALDYIFKSDIIGQIRDLPSISGRYGIPFSEIYITTEGTSITREAIEMYQNKPRFDFSIEYLHPVSNNRTAASVRDSIKWLQFK